ncbi:3-hydroxybutyryl-CoA dehydrogenase [Chishuiella sp.]|uniref:3-hydroxyacyl-CoA dehydrogenase family protein n=1 Tax=Chishuiella sp. TaxID=1969467 RepID=UPI0028AB32AB|nr:3-hydroxybutyryl-CoA dehydrogenase [Chishuiella sp.]
MKNITVIGAGTMGNGIAHVFAQAGFFVSLVDVSKESLEKGLKTIETNLDRMLSKEIITEADKISTLSNIKIFSDLKEAVKEADLVVEAATENLDLKLSIFKQIDEFAPSKTILTSNTSSISITRIASATNRPKQIIGMHFMNPVPMMKLVEIICGYDTSNETTNKIVEITEKLNKIPVIVNDYPGFIANRILMPMINEAIYSLYEGVAGVKQIDEVMKLGMAHPMGPLQLADFIGLDVCLSILEVLYDGFKNPKYAPCPLLVNMVTAGKKGVKSGEGFYDYSTSKKAEKLAIQFQK